MPKVAVDVDAELLPEPAGNEPGVLLSGAVINWPLLRDELPAGIEPSPGGMTGALAGGIVVGSCVPGKEVLGACPPTLGGACKLEPGELKLVAGIAGI